MNKFLKKVVTLFATCLVAGSLMGTMASAAGASVVWSNTNTSDVRQIRNYYKSKGSDAAGNTVVVNEASSTGNGIFASSGGGSGTTVTSTPVLDKSFHVYTLDSSDNKKYTIKFDEDKFNDLSENEQSKATSEMLQTVSAWQLDSKSVTSLAEKLENSASIVFSKADAVAILFNNGADIMSALTWFMPFQGGFSTVLGVGVIIVICLLLLSTVLDLVYIGLPTARMAMNANVESKDKEIPFGISTDALRIVQQQTQTGGDGGKSQGNPYLQYFKKRFLTYIILAVCILYLLSGQIGGLISGLLNLASGITG